MMYKMFFLLLFLSSNFYAQKEKALPALSIFEKHQKIRDFTINSANNEAYFTVQSPKEELSGIFKTIKENGVWKEPQLVKFSGSYKDLEPFLTQDGLRLYFASNRPLAKEDIEEKDFDIWYVVRTTVEEKWSSPKNAGSSINTKHNEFYPSLATNKNIYFTSDRFKSKSKDDIFYSKWNNNSYEKPICLSESINSNGYEFNAYVSPNESYLIFSGYNRNDGLGSGDLYISFKKKDNSWSKSKNMGTLVNSKQMDYCPFIDIKNNILYFTSKRTNVKTKKYTSTVDFLNEIQKYDNGLSKIYKVDVSQLLNSLQHIK